MDGSPPSVAALEHAIALAEDYGASVEILTIVPANDTLGPAPDVRAESERALDMAFERARSILGDRVRREVAAGDPQAEILEHAGEDVDLIVMGTHGRIGRLRSMLGSTAEGVVRNAPCPVLTVRDTSGGYQSFAERRHRRASVADRDTGVSRHH